MKDKLFLIGITNYFDGTALRFPGPIPTTTVQYLGSRFAKSFVYPINRIKDSEGTWVIHWRAKEKNGSWREFFMPTSELASPSEMSATLSSHEVFLTRTRNARSDMAEFAETLIETLQKYRVETKTYGQFGWTEDRKGFVMGTKMITEKGSHEVLCDPNIPTDVAVDFGRKGTLEEWISNIDTLYNRNGAEPFQFALCHSMGSILVELMGSSNWHGLPSRLLDMAVLVSQQRLRLLVDSMENLSIWNDKLEIKVQLSTQLSNELLSWGLFLYSLTSFLVERPKS